MGRKITIAVTGLHRGDNPQPGAAVARSLRRAIPDIRIVALSYDPLESALYSHDLDRVDSTYLMPYPGKGPQQLRERIAYVHDREHLDVLIPCLDSELSNFIEIHSELEQQGIATMLPPREAFERRAKENLSGFCKHHRIPAPRTLVVNDAAQLARCADEIGYPLYIKGKFYEAWLVYTVAELFEKFESLARTWGLPVLVQEALIGEEFDVVGLADGTGGIVGQCAIRKLLRTATGKGFGGIVVNDPELDRMSRQIIKQLSWCGPFEIEFLKTPGRPHVLFEINPRFPAWVDFPSQIGCNLPLRLLDMLLGRAPTRLEVCDAGQMFIRHSIDLVGDMAELAKLSVDGEYPHGTLAPTAEVAK
jgi:carbamoyl-phosphate synthase large subunit